MNRLPDYNLDPPDDPVYRFTLTYECPLCGHEWLDEWSSIVDNTCPDCGRRNISPKRIDDATECEEPGDHSLPTQDRDCDYWNRIK